MSLSFTPSASDMPIGSSVLLPSGERHLVCGACDTEWRGDRIRSRMQAVLKGKLGFTSEELVRYGLRPLRLPIGRSKTKKEQPAAAKTQQQGGGTVSPTITKPEDPTA